MPTTSLGHRQRRFPAPAGASESVPPISPWCNSSGKRIFDLICGVLLLIPGLPLMLFVAALIKATAREPILFRQLRVGRDGQQFELLKFRTMTDGEQSSASRVTQEGDPRITPLGRFLRRWKLDELPQLFNVLGGSMSLVGPRPDLAEYWDRFGEQLLPVLSVRPGVTGLATLEFRDEEARLAGLPADQVEDFYVARILPRKVERDREYLQSASFRSDLSMLLQTPGRVLTPKPKAGRSSD